MNDDQWKPSTYSPKVVQQMEGDHLAASVEFRILSGGRACYFKTELFSRLLGAKLAHETHAWDHDFALLFSLFNLLYFRVTFPNLGQTE